MSQFKLNLAFVGSGPWARKYHFPALAHLREQSDSTMNLRLRGFYSLDQTEATELTDQYAFEQVYANLDMLMTDPEVNAIAVVINPAALRDVLTLLAPSELPIFSEKPPGISYVEAQALSELITQPNLVAFNRRFIALNRHFKDIVAAMQDVYFVEGHFFRHERDELGHISQTAIHWINLMEFVFGEISHVRTERFNHPTTPTWVTLAHLRFADGLRGLLKILPCTGGQSERLEVHSPNQIAYLTGPFGSNAGQIVLETTEEGHLVETVIPGSSKPEIIERGIVPEYEAFFESVRSGRAAESTFQNAVNTMRIAEAIEQGIDL